jgi:uncharacterized protein YqhQ
MAFKIIRTAQFVLLSLMRAAHQKSNVGGQAVIEGVMMRGPLRWSVAVRGADGQIHIKREQLKRLPVILKLPLIRGVVALCQAVVLGIKAIDFSASKAYEDEEGKAMSPVAMVLTILVAILLGIVIFIFIPLYLTKLAGVFMPLVKENTFAFNLLDGLLRVGAFLIYVSAIGLWKEMRRIFEYHGAEHKVIHAYEEGGDLLVETIAGKYSPQHPRCGTSFLLIVMVVSIMVFSLIPHDWNFILKFFSRIVLIPVIAGISYETLKFSAKRSEKGFFRIFVQPGLFLQKLTTREPDESQIEVALSSLREVVEGRGG